MCEDPSYWERLARFLLFVEPLQTMRDLCAMPLKKPGPNGASASAAAVDASSSGCLRDYSTLVEFLCATSWPDGSRRERGTLLISVANGGWQLKVRDPNGARYAFYVAATLQDGLAGIDLGLSEDDLDWRPEKPFRSSGK